MRVWRPAAAAAVLSLLAVEASASIITFTSAGTLKSGFDQTGRFGAAGTDLAGASFSVIAYFDTELGTFAEDLTHSTLSGGPVAGGTPSPGYATLTVNGVTAQVYGNSMSMLIGQNGGTSQAFLLDRWNVGPVETVSQIFVSLNAPGSLLDFHLQPGFHSDCPAGQCGGSFFFTSYNVPGGGDPYFYDAGFFDPDYFDVSGPIPVPEPATWGLMILGFGLAGGALRRRRLAAA